MSANADRWAFPRPEAVDDAIVVYCTLGCSFCVMLRRALTRAGIEFADIDVTGNAEARRWLLESTGETSVPQVFVGGRPVGGYSAVRSLIRSGAWTEMVRSGTARGSV